MGVVTELSSVLKSGGAHLETWWEGEERWGRGGGEEEVQTNDTSQFTLTILK